jgi:anti-sigma regulatory factor (Ser/Thr protein kinase)
VSSPLNWHVDSRDGLVIVTVAGTSDADAALELHRVIMRHLHREPVGVLLDLSQAAVADRESAAIFASLAHEADSWPGTPVLLCTANEITADLIAKAAGKAPPLFGTTAEAVATLTDPGPPVTERILPVPGAARHARDVVSETCLRWELPHLLGPVTLVVSELVTNAVVHARSPVTLRIRLRPRHLYLAVFDDDQAEPVLRAHPATDASGGRGLHLVEHVATRWGHQLMPGGKVVWAAFAVNGTA